MNWSRRMNTVIEYIENNLSEKLSLEDVAKVACCSKYHFHRMFFSHFQVTCSEYIRRRKLTLAAVEIINSDKPIVDIALSYGYESTNAFTRAFRNIHQIPPSKARSDSVTLSSYNRVFYPVKHRGGEKMDYKIIARPEFTLVGKSKRFEFDKFIKEGPSFWKEYVTSNHYQNLCNLTGGRPGPITHAPLLSAYFPIEERAQDEFIDVLGVEASNVNDSAFEAHIVPSATYAEFDCTYKTSMKTNRYIYGEWFSSTGYERDGSKPDIVGYFPIPFKPISEMRVRWWIPVMNKNE